MQAVAKAPDKFVGYIGIGQVADIAKSELDSLEFSLAEAALAGNTKDVERLEQLWGSIEKGESLTPKNLVKKYCGASRLIDDNKDYTAGFLFNREYNLLDVIRYSKGIAVSQNILIPEILENNIPNIVDKLDIPTYFVMGKYDYMTSVSAEQEYFNVLKAPEKEFVVFDISAHYPQFEERCYSLSGWIRLEVSLRVMGCKTE